MTTPVTAAPDNESAPQYVLEEAGDDFAPRTRKSTSDQLTALKPALTAVKDNPGKVYTIAKGLTAAKSAALVALLNGHYPKSYTFGARSTADGDAVVQAKYDEANPRPVRTVTRKPVTAEAKAARANKAAAKRNRR